LVKVNMKSQLNLKILYNYVALDLKIRKKIETLTVHYLGS